MSHRRSTRGIRVFYLLFTRTIDARMPKDVRAPFAGGDDRLELGGQVVTRVESGDRPIDPLYPSLLWMGSTAFDVSAHDSWRTLRDPRYARLLAALSAAAAGAAARPALARALMQADLWSAFDLLYVPPEFRTSGRRAPESEMLLARRDHLLSELARLIRMLALTRPEIAALPDTYAVARGRYGLPDLFNPASGQAYVCNDTAPELPRVCSSSPRRRLPTSRHSSMASGTPIGLGSSTRWRC